MIRPDILLKLEAIVNLLLNFVALLRALVSLFGGGMARLLVEESYFLEGALLGISEKRCPARGLFSARSVDD